MNQGSLSNFENGGITNEMFITDPDAIQQSFTPREIPVKFTNTWNSLRNNRYFYQEDIIWDTGRLQPTRSTKGLDSLYL